MTIPNNSVEKNLNYSPVVIKICHKWFSLPVKCPRFWNYYGRDWLSSNFGVSRLVPLFRRTSASWLQHCYYVSAFS